MMSAAHMFDVCIVTIMHAPVNCSGQTGVLHSPSSNNFNFLFHLFHSCILMKSHFSMNKSALHLFDLSVVIIMHAPFS